MSSLSIAERRDGDRVIVSLVGRADLASEAELDRELTRLGAARPPVLIFDLAGLEFMTSLAIGQLVALTSGLRRHGGEVVLAAANPFIRGMLERARLQQVFRLAPDLESALRPAATS